MAPLGCRSGTCCNTAFALWLWSYAPGSSRSLQDGLRASLLPLHGLTHLRVVFYSNMPRPDLSSDARGNEEYQRALRGPPFERADETAASLVRALPSLQYIFLTATGHVENYTAGSTVHDRQWHAAGAWRVAEPQTGGMKDKDKSPVLVGLHDDVAETIIRTEELVLSKADEVCVFSF